MTLVEFSPSFVVLAAALIALAALSARVSGLGVGRDAITAAARACVQLAAIATVLSVLLEAIGLALLFVLVMMSVATLTGARRITRHASGAWVALAIGAGALPVLGLVFASGAVARSGPGIVAVSGIVVGGTMTGAAQAGRRALDELRMRRGEVEAALSLGFPSRAAGLEIAREPAAQALIPPLDQTRTVGLVTLPGAFIGVLLGGGSVVDAAAAQLLVLLGLVAAQITSVAVTLELVVRGRILDGDVPPGRRDAGSVVVRERRRPLQRPKVRRE